MMPGKFMRQISRESISEEFEVFSNKPIPEVPKAGARIKVCYAGACYTDQEVKKSGQKRLTTPGIQDTSLFPGYELSGIVDEICETVQMENVRKGDKVIMYPEEDHSFEAGYADYVTVNDVNNLIKVPSSMDMQVASLLPCGALRAYAAALRLKQIISMKNANSGGTTNVLIIGAGGLGLWTLKLAEHLLDNNSGVHIAVADTSVEQLMVAKNQGCFDIIHWNEAIHEEYIHQRTKNVCKGGVDIIIDFVSSSRTINRGIKVLNEEGILLVGGNSKYEVSFCLYTLARKGQSILGIPKGTREQLLKLVDIFNNGQMQPPVYTVFPVDQANQVFRRLSQCQINGRAVFRLSPSEELEDPF